MSKRKQKRKQITCRCNGYPFPHREGSGECFVDQGEFFCGNCGHPTHVKSVDEGYGPGEFWGQKYNHVNIVPVSTCCTDVVYVNASLTREFDPIHYTE